MKLFTLISLIFFSAAILIRAQIPNADFENWTNGTPDGWFADNVPPSLLPVTQTTDAESGTSAVKGEVISSMGATLTPLIVAGSSSNNQGIAVAARYSSLNGYYKFSPVQDDSMIVIAVMYKNGNKIGTAVVEPTAAGSYTHFGAPITYSTSDIPDTCRITISIINPAGASSVHTGSVMYVDNLSFGTVTSVDGNKTVPDKFSLDQNYPNPFNPSTKITYSLPESGFAKIVIYNVLGEEVKTLITGNQSAGLHNVSADFLNLASGIYIYRLNFNGESGKSFSSMKKMILMK